MDLRETGWEVVDWIHLVQDSDQLWVLMNMVRNLRVP
jgi:hypothetical protein